MVIQNVKEVATCSIKEQEMLLLNNMKIAYEFHKNHVGKINMESEDLLQECYTLLWKAVTTYDKEKAEFSTYAYRILTNGLNMLYNSSGRQKRSAKIVSLYNLIEESGDCDITYEDAIADDKTNIENEAIENISCEKINEIFKSMADEETQEYLHLKLKGVKRKKIAKILNISYSRTCNIDKKIARIQKKMKV